MQEQSCDDRALMQQPKLVESKFKLRDNYPFVNYSKEMGNESLKPTFHLVHFDGAN